MNWIKLAVLAVAISACGGGEKKTETPTTETPTTETPTTETKTTEPAPTPPPTAAVEATCENAVAHGMSIMVKAGMATQAQVDQVKEKALAKCKAENPPKAALECVLKATTPQEVAGCDPKKKEDSNLSTTPRGK